METQFARHREHSLLSLKGATGKFPIGKHLTPVYYDSHSEHM
jgi:hypothetical protein